MNSSNLERDYWMQLFANLLNACPVDTRNMKTHIVMFENPNEFVIEVNAPYVTNPKLQKKGIIKNTVNKIKLYFKGDYAYFVNYANKSPHQYWIQNQINQTARIFNARITFLGGE
jgi:hypothetical protein